MIRRKLNYEVVPVEEYTDFSDRYAQEKKGPSNGVLLTAATAATASLATMAVTKYTNPTTIAPPIPLPQEAAIIEPTNVLSAPVSAPLSELSTALPVTFDGSSMPDMIPTGMIADKSLNMLANALDPVVQIIVALSFPIASVVIVGSCLLFIIGQSEKAWTFIMNAGLGYILIQLSPLILNVLRQIGKAVA